MTYSKEHSARGKKDIISKDEYKKLTKKKGRGRSKRTTRNGKSYQSELEACVADELALRKLAGEVTFIKEQYKVAHYINGQFIAANLIDFMCELPDGRMMFVEAKGWESEKFKICYNLHIAQLGIMYPGCEYWIVRGRCNYLKWEEVKLIKES